MRIFSTLTQAAFAAFFMSVVYSAPYQSIETPEPLSRVYVSPDGTGDQSGIDISNALPVADLWSQINSAAPGTAFTLLAGEYDGSGSHELAPNGTPEAPIFIEANHGDEVTLTGIYQLSDGTGGQIPFLLTSGNVVIRGFNIRNVRYAIGLQSGYVVDNVVIEAMNIDNVSECINTDKNSSKTRAATNWVISNVHCTDYYRAGIRVYSGVGPTVTNGITIRNLYANPCIDRSETNAPANQYVAGVQVGEGAQNVAIKDSFFENNLGDCAGSGSNGDGIALENAAQTVAISNVEISNAGDACIDSKAPGVTINGATCVGANYGFKFWYHADTHCTTCAADNVRVSYTHLISGANPTFSDSAFWCRGGDDRVINSHEPDANTGAILNGLVVIGSSSCEQDPADNYNAPNNDLTGVVNMESLIAPVLVNSSTYRVR